MRASENDTDDSIRLPKGLYVKPELDSKNPEGKTEVNVDVGKSFKFPWEVKQEENDRLRKENNAKIAAAAARAQQQQSGASGSGSGKQPPAKTPPAMSPQEMDEYEKRRNQAFQESDWKKSFYKE